MSTQLVKSENEDRLREDRRWELLVLELYGTLTPEELKELTELEKQLPPANLRTTSKLLEIEEFLDE